MHLCPQELLALASAVPVLGWLWRAVVAWLRSRGKA